MKFECEYEIGEMAILLESFGERYRLEHSQWVGNPKSFFNKWFGTVKYKAILSKSELESLYRVLLQREFGKITISKSLQVVREQDKYSQLQLKFSSALELVPLPRTESEALIGAIGSEVNNS